MIPQRGNEPPICLRVQAALARGSTAASWCREHLTSGRPSAAQRELATVEAALEELESLPLEEAEMDRVEALAHERDDLLQMIEEDMRLSGETPIVPIAPQAVAGGAKVTRSR